MAPKRTEQPTSSTEPEQTHSDVDLATLSTVASGADIAAFGLGQHQDPEVGALLKQLLRTQLRTAEVSQRKAEAEANKFDADTRTVEQKAAAAQRQLKSEELNRKTLRRVCKHKQGGTGLENIYSGKGEPSLIVIDLCIPGYQYIHCYRCGGEWFSPDPALETSNPKLYAKKLRIFTKMLRRAGNSENTAMSGPVFLFKKNGVPFIPARV